MSRLSLPFTAVSALLLAACGTSNEPTTNTDGLNPGPNPSSTAPTAGMGPVSPNIPGPAPTMPAPLNPAPTTDPVVNPAPTTPVSEPDVPPVTPGEPEPTPVGPGVSEPDQTGPEPTPVDGPDSGAAEPDVSPVEPAVEPVEPTPPPPEPIVQPEDPCAPRAGYRNLFIELLSKTQAEADAKVDGAFQQMFHGGEDEKLYYESGNGAYILDVNNNDIRSEGMSYGMTIAVLLDHKEEFDKLWQWSKDNMAQDDDGYFAWQVSPDGRVIDSGSAPDGEEYFATALILASKRWGDGMGTFNYSGQARDLLSAMANNGLFNQQSHLIVFSPSGNAAGYTDPSYVLPAFYEMWACYDPGTRSFWESAVTAGRQHLRNAAHPMTGLAPYLANFDGSPHPNGPDFDTDAWRVVGNIMMDHHLFTKDPWQTTFAENYASFFESQRGVTPIPAEFTISGQPTVSYDEPAKGLVSQNGLVAFGTSPEQGRPFVQDLWDTPIPTGQYRYYDGMLYLLALLHANGQFQLE